jgi:hypothetical protein
MSPQDEALFHQARGWYTTGKKRQAYMQFRSLYLNNPRNAALLIWIGYTTLDIDEAKRMLESVEMLKPNHPSLPKLRKRVSKLEWKSELTPRPRQYILPQRVTCQHCGYEGKPLILRKIPQWGWIVFAVLSSVQIALIPAISVSGRYILFFFYPACWVGLLLRRNVCVCIRCWTELGDISMFQ